MVEVLLARLICFFVSGHVPSALNANCFVRLGADKEGAEAPASGGVGDDGNPSSGRAS